MVIKGPKKKVYKLGDRTSQLDEKWQSKLEDAMRNMERVRVDRFEPNRNGGSVARIVEKSRKSQPEII